ncbi:MAG: hypothetical protein OEL88_06860 [Sterolibacteriaceae bacterium MAG5]|nr:hypothetical protein [Candidatus Nitricoxidireducens bremensis]
MSAILDPPSAKRLFGAKKFIDKLPGFSAWEGTCGQGGVKLICDKKIEHQQ